MCRGRKEIPTKEVVKAVRKRFDEASVQLQRRPSGKERLIVASKTEALPIPGACRHAVTTQDLFCSGLAQRNCTSRNKIHASCDGKAKLLPNCWAQHLLHHITVVGR